MTGRFSTKLLAAIAALSLMGSGVAVADETADTAGAPSIEVSAEPSVPEVTPSAEPTLEQDADNNTVQLDTDANSQLDVSDENLTDVLADTGGANACPADPYIKYSVKGPPTLLVGQTSEAMLMGDAKYGDKWEQAIMTREDYDREYSYGTPSFWSSSNTNVATVDKYGYVSGKAPGTATITASYWDDEDKCVLTMGSFTVTVVQPVVKVSSVGVSGASKVQVGKKIALKASVAPSNATNKGVSWKSSNTKIATVDSKGKVTGKKAGKVTITATAQDGSG
ncbi:MAG: Ig-like domain-containing protein, partial [Actinomycetaceae bacterium]|nr:Ig-like domain-containing protein [Actinomycetaceae bacterium]